jgi:hypothetical protein
MEISQTADGFTQKLGRRLLPAPEVRSRRAILSPAIQSPATPSGWALATMVTITLGAYLFSKVHQQGSWLLAANWLDNGAYIAVSHAITTGQWISPTDSPTPFFGFPLAIAAVTRTGAFNEWAAVIAISLVSMLITCACLRRLYGPPAVLSLLILSWDWVGIGVLGGSEAPFCACLFVAFLCARSGRWRSAAVLAAVATTIRPIGVFALVALFLTRFRRHAWRSAAEMTLLGLMIAAVYFAFARALTGDAWINFRTYRVDWNTGWPVGPPIVALIHSAVPLVRASGWWSAMRVLVIVAVTAAAGIHVAYRIVRGRWSLPEAESIFAVLVVTFLLCYPYRNMAYEWPRFLIPALPVLTAAHASIVPQGRRFWWLVVLANAGVLSTAWMRVIP